MSVSHAGSNPVIMVCVYVCVSVYVPENCVKKLCNSEGKAKQISFERVKYNNSSALLCKNENS